MIILKTMLYMKVNYKGNYLALDFFYNFSLHIIYAWFNSCKEARVYMCNSDWLFLIERYT